MLLAVDGLDFEGLEDWDWDCGFGWDCEGELAELEDGWGFAGGCCWVC
ncbi:hypothetical protein ACNKU7_15460 [Microbulbifer sp. SA54]